MSRKKNSLATALDEERYLSDIHNNNNLHSQDYNICYFFSLSDTSFRTLPTDEEQTNYSFDEDRTFRKHRPFTDKENRTESKKATKSSPRKMVKPPLTKTKPLQAATKLNQNSFSNRGHSRVFHDDSDSSSNPSQNVRQTENRSPTRASPRINPKTSEKAPNKNASPNRHRRKLKMPTKKPAGVLNEIRILQNTCGNLIPMLPFGRLVKEIMQNRTIDSMRITPLALQAIRDAGETYLVGLFEDVNRITLNRNQVTIQVKDMELALFIRGHS